MRRVYIIAEIGCNHNGDFSLAKELVSQAYECGVDAVKFQTFKASSLISKYAPKAAYQVETTGNTESQLEMTAKLELSHRDYIALREFACSLGLDVFSTPFDMGSIDFLNSLNQNIWKIPSGEITNLPYLEAIRDINCPDKRIVVSSGMATIDEISTCISILSANGTKTDRIVLLHCNTEYPTPDSDVNITAISDLKRKFEGIEIGFSDHSVGILAAVAAVALGATVVEKHFTMDKALPGPDHHASATPDELKELCVSIRRMEQMYGCGSKVVTKSEKKNIVVARKSIVAKTGIKAGEMFSKENITCKRPGSGISPMFWYKVLGQVSNRDYSEDELIELDGYPCQQK